MSESAKEPQEQPELPTKEQVKAFYEEQIELTELRARLARAQYKIVEYEAKRLHHLTLISQIQGAQPKENDEPKEPEANKPEATDNPANPFIGNLND